MSLNAAEGAMRPLRLEPIAMLPLALAGVTFVLIKVIVWTASSPQPLVWLTLLTTLTCFATWFAHWRFRGLRVVGGGIGLMLGLYAALGQNGFALSPDASLTTTWFVEGFWAIALFTGIAGLWRPALILVPSLATLAYKRICELDTGIPITETDYLPVVELGMLIGLQQFFVAVTSIRSSPAPVRSDLLTLLACLSIHFGNYFWSAIAKARLSDDPLDWVLHNRTDFLMLTTWDAGVMPLAAAPSVAAWIYELLAANVVALNAATFALQLGAVVAVLNPVAAIFLTIAYDITHVVIFAVSGIFFWKWIILNGLLVAALSGLRSLQMTWSLRAMLVAGVLLGHLAFFTARLGWYDTASITIPRIVAHTESTTALVPSNWFRAVSVTVAQGRLGWPYPGHFDLHTFGTTFSEETRLHADACALRPADPMPPLSLPAHVTEYIRRHHEFALSLAQPDHDQETAYNRYPHHIWSAPGIYDRFAAMDKRRIRAYSFVVQSRCLWADERGLHARTLGESRVTIDLGPEAVSAGSRR